MKNWSASAALQTGDHAAEDVDKAADEGENEEKPEAEAAARDCEEKVKQDALKDEDVLALGDAPEGVDEHDCETAASSEMRAVDGDVRVDRIEGVLERQDEDVHAGAVEQ